LRQIAQYPSGSREREKFLREKDFRTLLLGLPRNSNIPLLPGPSAHNIAPVAMHFTFGEESDVAIPTKQSERTLSPLR
jgi:hypothetical protein